MVDVVFKHGLSFNDFLAEFLARKDTHRLVSIASYGSPQDALHAGIWVAANSPPGQQLTLDAEPSAAAASQQAAADAGMVPQLVSVTANQHAKAISIVYEPIVDIEVDSHRRLELQLSGKALGIIDPGPNPFASSAMSPEKGSATFYDKDAPSGVPKFFNVLALDCYNWGPYADRFYAAVLASNGDNRYPRSVMSLPAASLGPDSDWNAMDEHAILRKGWARPEFVVPSSRLQIPQNIGPARDLVTLWLNDTFKAWPDDLLDPQFDMGAQVRGPMAPDAVDATVTDMASMGYVPYRVGANGEEPHVGICIVFRWAAASAPLPKAFLVVDGRDKAPLLRVPPLRLDHPLHPTDILGVPQKSTIEHQNAADLFQFQATHSALSSQQTASLVAFAQGLPTSPFHKWAPPDQLPPEPPPHPGPPSPPQVLGLEGGAKQDLSAFTDPYRAFDDYIERLMRQFNIRSAQIAVARTGALKIVRSYTLAEENYPVTQSEHLFPIGSVSKTLPAMGAVAALAPNGALPDGRNPLALMDMKTLLEVSPVNGFTDAALEVTTLDNLLRHRSGWTPNIDFHEETIAQYARPSGQRPAEPGDARSFVQAYPGSLYNRPIGPSVVTNVTLKPSTDQVYQGLEYLVVSELVSKHKVGSWGEHARAMLQLWNLKEAKARPRPSTIEKAFDAGIIPLNDADLAFGRTYRHDAPGEWFLQPAPYYGNSAYAAAIGAWTMSAATLARILCGMDVESRVQQFLQPAAVRLMYEPRILSDSFALQVFVQPAPTSPDKWSLAEVDLFNNGALQGCNCGIRYRLPALGPEFGGTWASVVCFNQQVGDEQTAAATMLQYAVQMEEDHRLPLDDLFYIL